MRRQAKERRVYAKLEVTRRSIAVVAGLGLVLGIAAVTQVASASQDPASLYFGEANECAVTTADLEVHVEEEAPGVLHHHYRAKATSGHGDHEASETESADAAGCGETATATGAQPNNAAPTVSCPTVDGSLPQSIPTQARSGIDRELGNLLDQIKGANQRIVDTQGEGGPNFIQNAILGPLQARRTAALERIEIELSRVGVDAELQQLANCELNATGPGPADSQVDGEPEDSQLGAGSPSGQPDSPDSDEESEDPPPPTESNIDPADITFFDCDQSSGLDRHIGFQDGPRCVDIEMGDVTAAEDNPSLLITSAPGRVSADEGFTVQVSTRNLERTVFHAAADGGYYLQGASVSDAGITEGHFHFGCRRLDNASEAELPDTDPEFFVAIEDNGGGVAPDAVDVEVPPLEEPGLYRCMAWAGDASHRVPMMQFARHFVAVDVVRIIVE